MRLALRLLLLAAVALLAVACGLHSETIPARPWGLVSIDGRAPIADARVEFGNDGRMTVQPGCNTGGGPYSIDGNHVRIGELAITAMLCADDAINAQEAAILAVLGADPTFAVDTATGELRLEANGTTLVFVTP